jgi:hypothetical protein
MRFTCTFIVAALAAAPASGQVQPAPGYKAELYFGNPQANQALVSFDWGWDGALYYSTGATNWLPGMSVWRQDAGGSSLVFEDAGVYAGSWVAAAGQNVYFNEDSHFRVYATDGAGPPRLVLEQPNLWGLFPRGQDMFLSGADAFWTAALYVAPIDASGNPGAPVELGKVGNGSGPLAWDADGNFYVAEGYNGSAQPGVFRFSAAELEAAMADPAGAALNSAGHLWTTLERYLGGGATGLAFDGQGGLLVTATIFDGPSELRRYDIAGGVAGDYTVLGTSPSRLTTVRVADGLAYVASPEGIYCVSTPEPATLGALAAGLGAMLLRRRRG